MAERRTYTNPVYAGYFADPFAWEHGGTYYAIGTGAPEAAGQVDIAVDQRVEENRNTTVAASVDKVGKITVASVFPLLYSEDFVTWQFAGYALVRPDPALGDSFWAPEVAYCDGIFYLYYSVGWEDKQHQLRVATSEHPLGPYHDIGSPLLQTDPPFAIDPHPFRDGDGQWYLFYACDFLDTAAGARSGTALKVDRLVNMTQLAGESRVVLRARSDWQRFLASRSMYGGIYDWHTLEGPCVRKHAGRYYCFYSGGRWETESYGVDYGVADTVMGDYSDAGNESGPRVLRSIPDRVLGPGHNSIVVSPDHQDEYIVYHAWNQSKTKRQMCLDKLIWTPDGPRCLGPTWLPQTINS